MKNITHIISRLQQNQLKHLSTLDIINKLILTLPKAVREGIIFATLKGETLFIATRHISLCAEINNFRANDLLSTIKTMLDCAPKNSPLSQNLAPLKAIKQIKAYTPRDILQNLDDEKIVVRYYKERATGDFEIDENSPFKEIFENIKLAIKRNIENELKRKN